MFHNIPKLIKERIKYLEEIDSRDRINGTPRLERLRQIPPETGKFLALMAASAPNGEILEIGTSAGYSTLWIALACKNNNKKITTFEILKEKIKMAKETFKTTKLENKIDLIEGNVLQYLHNYKNISFCFLDAEKAIYQKCYDLIIPNMIKGGIFIADNAISHYDRLKLMLENVLNDYRVDGIIVPLGKGLLLCKKI